MPPLQAEFLDWLLEDQRRPSSQAAWAREHEVNERTVREWKRDPRFRTELDRRAAEKNTSTELVQEVLDRLRKVFLDTGDVGAAKLWLDHSNRLKPPKQVVNEEEFAQLSDEDLVRELALGLGFDADG